MEAKKTDRRGGAKPNAGRKKIPPEERKVQLSFYVRSRNARAVKEKIERIIAELDI